MKFQSLAMDDLRCIMQCLSIRDLLAVSETCRKLRRLVLADPFLWRSTLPPPAANASSASAAPIVPAADRVCSDYLRVRAVVERCESVPDQHAWLACRPEAPHSWALLTLGSQCDHITWCPPRDANNGLPTPQLLHWTRDDSFRFEAYCRTVWWFDVSTSFRLPQEAMYRAFVIYRIERSRLRQPCPNIDSILRMLLRDVVVYCDVEGHATTKILGRLTGNTTVAVREGTDPHSAYYVFTSAPVRLPPNAKVVISLKDHNTQIEKTHMGVCGIGVARAASEMDKAQFAEHVDRLYYRVAAQRIGDSSTRYPGNIFVLTEDS